MIKHKVEELIRPRRGQNFTNKWTDGYKYNKYSTINNRCGNRFNYKKKEKYADTKMNISKEEFFDLMEKDYYEIPNITIEVDKDIKKFGVEYTNEYSIDTITFVPKFFNNFFENFDPVNHVKYNEKKDSWEFKIYDSWENEVHEIDYCENRFEAMEIYCEIKQKILKKYIKYYSEVLPSKVVKLLKSKNLKDWWKSWNPEILDNIY